MVEWSISAVNEKTAMGNFCLVLIISIDILCQGICTKIFPCEGLHSFYPVYAERNRKSPAVLFC